MDIFAVFFLLFLVLGKVHAVWPYVIVSILMLLGLWGKNR